MTIAIHGFDLVDMNTLQDNPSQFLTNGNPEVEQAFTAYPNPTTRRVFFNQTTDVAIYDATGKRVMVRRNTTDIDVSSLTPGYYFLRNTAGETIKLSVQ